MNRLPAEFGHPRPQKHSVLFLLRGGKGKQAREKIFFPLPRLLTGNRITVPRFAFSGKRPHQIAAGFTSCKFILIH